MKNCSFTDIIKKYEIIIPMIQRDYAQGRDDVEVKKVRRALLKAIYTAIQKHEIIKLDFVYGYIERIDKQERFIPLDGQQRLTTLFLLHCFTAIKSKNFTDKAYLNNFRYEARASSTDFTNALVKNIEHICNKQDEKISRKIKNSSWFFTSWEHDPTVLAMLTMLDAIEEMYHVELSYESLDKIKFDFINLNEFRLSDDLYLKMNARGVQLTPFEKFKATFQKILENKKFDDLKEDFKSRIDGEWLDLFWNMDENKGASIFTKSVTMKCSEKKEYEYRTIDEPFMRFFWYITEMLYFKKGLVFNYKGKNKDQLCDIDDNAGEKKITAFDYNIDLIEEKLIERVYDVDDVKYLFKTLDESKNIKNLCEKTLSKEYEKGKVSLFKDHNIFQKLVTKGNLDYQEKLILFVIINYVYDDLDKNNSDDNHLHDLVRVTRNLLLRVRKKSGISFVTDLTNEKIHKAINIISWLTNNESVYSVLQKNRNSIDELLIIKNDEQKNSVDSEIKKAKLITQYPELRDAIFKLEDHPEVKGAIHNFMPETEESFSSEFIVNFQSRVKVFNQIWSYDCSLVVRAFISCGEDYHVWIKNSNLGGLWFFGNKENWNIILTQNRSNDKFLVNFLDRFYGRSISRDKLEDIISRYLVAKCEKGKEKVSWRYYFIKYKKMTCINKDGYKNLYSWYDGFRIRDLSGITLKGWHVNPYARVIWEILDRKEGIFKGIFSESSYETPLLLSNDIGLYCEEEGKGWRVEPSLMLVDKRDYIKIEEFKENNEVVKFYLKPTKKMDMIEVAVAFICELYQLENPLDKNKVVDSYAEVVA